MRGFWKTVLALAVVALIALFIYLFFKAGPVYLLGGFATLVEWICWILIGIATVTLITNPLRKTVMGYYVADLAILVAWFIAIQLFFSRGPSSIFTPYTGIVHWICVAIIVIAAIVTIVRWVIHAMRAARHETESGSDYSYAAQAGTVGAMAAVPVAAASYAAASPVVTTASGNGYTAYEQSAVRSSTPVTSAPVAQAAVPVEQAVAPVQVAAPVVQTAAPVEQAAAPVEQAVAPVQAAVPVAQAAVPVTQAAAPAVQASPEPQVVQTVPEEAVVSTGKATVAAETPAKPDWGAWDAWGVAKAPDVADQPEPSVSEAVAQADTSDATDTASSPSPSADAIESSWTSDADGSLDRAELLSVLDQDQLMRFLAGSLMDEGYRVKKSKTSAAKGASAMIAKRGDTKAFVVCCKDDDVTGDSAVARAIRESKDLKCNGVVMAVTGTFSQKAQALAAKKGVTLWDREDLRDFI